MTTPTPVAAPTTTPATQGPTGGASSSAATPSNVSPTGDVRELTINGKKVKVSVDDAFNGYAKGAAADEMFRSAAESKKQVEQLLMKFKEAPDSVIEQLAAQLKLDPEQVLDQLAEKRNAKRLQAEQDAKLTPEQRELKQLREEKAQRDREAAEKEQAKQQREQQVKYETTVKLIASSIEKALDALNLPKNDTNIARVARALKELNASDEAIVGGKVNMTRLLERMVAQGSDHFKWVTQDYNAKRIVDMMPEDVMENVLKEYLARKQVKKTTEITAEKEQPTRKRPRILQI